MVHLGKKHICTNPDCGIRFYDFGKPEPICPKCARRVSELEEKEVLERRSKRAVEEEPAAEEEEEPAAEAEKEAEGEAEEVEEGLEEEEYLKNQEDTADDFEYEYEE
jgi:hypothetical protein